MRNSDWSFVSEEVVAPRQRAGRVSCKIITHLINPLRLNFIAIAVFRFFLQSY
jgi:hypothetical protein